MSRRRGGRGRTILRAGQGQLQIMGDGGIALAVPFLAQPFGILRTGVLGQNRCSLKPNPSVRVAHPSKRLRMGSLGIPGPQPIQRPHPRVRIGIATCLFQEGHRLR